MISFISMRALKCFQTVSYSISDRGLLAILFFVTLPVAELVILPHTARFHSSTRPPPHLLQNPLSPSSLFSDQSGYVQLGDDVGTVLAVGDFTADRYTDLLILPTYASRPRRISILCWNHSSYSFRPPSPSKNNSYSPVFSIDSIPSMSSHASIASAATFDANSDGLLDVLLVILLSPYRYTGAILFGDGSGSLKFNSILPDVNPYSLILDANDDMLYDIFFVTPNGDRIFYINKSRGMFERHVWVPWSNSTACIPTYPHNSNSFVDVNGDCTPDLVVTSSCGMEVWLNHSPNRSRTNAWPNGHIFLKHTSYFHQLTVKNNSQRLLLLNRTVWDPSNGDGHAVFADFNADGSMDIAVLNQNTQTVRISYYIRRPRIQRILCSYDPLGYYNTHVSLHDVIVSATTLGDTLVQPTLHVGDCNFDGLIDILALDGNSGTVALYVSSLMADRYVWFAPQTWPLASTVKRIFFPILGSDSTHLLPKHPEVVNFVRYSESPILHQIEDPLAVAFFDTAESGRQDILVSQRHGTRLIWNNFQKMEDSVYFKAIGVDAAHDNPSWEAKRISIDHLSQAHPRAFSPLPGNTFKIAYGGRHRYETQICSQCSQSAVLGLQSCMCHFGITRIANYIEEMAMGGSSGVRTWLALMPNALAVVWPQRYAINQKSPQSQSTAIKWKVSYLSRGRDGQLERVVCVLGVTLGVLLIAILYIENIERLENRNLKLLEYT